MADVYRSTVEEDSTQPAVSWGAILVGGICAAALTVALIALGTGTGLALVSPWSNSGVSATTFKWSAGAYLVLVAIVASAVGGYMSGRLRTKWTGAHSQEVVFRDTAHGFAAWAFATVMGVLVLGAATTSLLGSATGGGVQGAAQGAAQGTSAAPTDYFVDTLLRPNPATATAGGTTQPADASATRREVGSIFARDFATGTDFPAADRTYLAQVVAARAGLSQQDAEKRVDDVIAQTKAYLDSARKYAIALAMWVTLALFAGAFAASAAAVEGGQLRDGRWRGVIFAGRYQPRTVS